MLLRIPLTFSLIVKSHIVSYKTHGSGIYLFWLASCFFTIAFNGRFHLKE